MPTRRCSAPAPRRPGTQAARTAGSLTASGSPTTSTSTRRCPTATPSGVVYYASLAGSYLGRVDPTRSTVRVLQPPTRNQGARRAWSDSKGRIWVSEWNTGNLSRYTPDTDAWDTWPLPGENPETYAVFVDESDIVWASDFGSNSMVRFDSITEQFDTYALPHDPGNVRQILGRSGEVWFPESAADNLIAIRTAT